MVRDLQLRSLELANKLLELLPALLKKASSRIKAWQLTRSLLYGGPSGSLFLGVKFLHDRPPHPEVLSLATLQPVEVRVVTAQGHLWRLDANCVVITRPFPSWPRTRVTSASRTVVSLSVRPGDRTFVESLMNRATPSLPAMQRSSLNAVNHYVGADIINQALAVVLCKIVSEE